ncbi:hypothetical protein BDZ91DRAFT_799835 [Kalaharituber pfeilii]|nr:hypothetical protein BDZ91DRAFT_799835 [Kalaharituber pfeilii]
MSTDLSTGMPRSALKRKHAGPMACFVREERPPKHVSFAAETAPRFTYHIEQAPEPSCSWGQIFPNLRRMMKAGMFNSGLDDVQGMDPKTLRNTSWNTGVHPLRHPILRWPVKAIHVWSPEGVLIDVVRCGRDKDGEHRWLKPPDKSELKKKYGKREQEGIREGYPLL